ncbi:MAG: hypothetical protein JWR80_5471 [Bradyrhizobium sp.]|nr:hypothetical protein [Bradyrhizobium sp.]
MTTPPAADLPALVPSGDWRGYEAYVAGVLAAHFGNIRFDQDVHLPGKLSGAPRQIDIMAQALEPTAIECNMSAARSTWQSLTRSSASCAMSGSPAV